MSSVYQSLGSHNGANSKLADNDDTTETTPLHAQTKLVRKKRTRHRASISIGDTNRQDGPHPKEYALLNAEKDGKEVEREKQGISNSSAIIHLFKGSIGTGILAMPNAIVNSGLVIGPIGLVVISVICVFAMHMLEECSQELAFRSQTPFMDYADVAEHAFLTMGPRGGWFSKQARRYINISLCIAQIGFCSVYISFIAKSLQLVIGQNLGTDIGQTSYMAATLLPLFLLCSIRNLQRLSPVSMLANILQMTSLGIIFYYLVQRTIPIWELKYYSDLSQYPLFFGTAIYTFEGIGVLLPLETKMQTPKAMRKWNGVLNTTTTIVTCLYISTGVLGYMKYGEDVKGSITLNLPVEELLAQAAIIMFAVAIMFSYSLQLYVPVQIILSEITARVTEKWTLLSEYILRCGLVLVTFILAASIPGLDFFISLVGSVCLSTVALIAPSILHSVTFWNELTKYPTGRMRLLLNSFISFVGIAGFLSGGFVSLSEIITYFNSGVE